MLRLAAAGCRWSRLATAGQDGAAGDQRGDRADEWCYMAGCFPMAMWNHGMKAGHRARTTTVDGKDETGKLRPWELTDDGEGAPVRMEVTAFEDRALLSFGEVHGGMASCKAAALSSQQRVVCSSSTMFKENSELGKQSSPDLEERRVQGEEVVSSFSKGEADVPNGAGEGVRRGEDGAEHVVVDIVDEEAWRGRSLKEQHGVAGKVEVEPTSRCLARRRWWRSIVARSRTWTPRWLAVVTVVVEDDVAAALPFGGDSDVARWKEGATRHDEARSSRSEEGRGCSGVSVR